MHSNASRRNLFDTPQFWLNDPLNCYRLWLQGQDYKDSTNVVYEAMFSRFCQWLKQSGRNLGQCEVGDIALFLNSPNENIPESRRTPQHSRQRRQYLRQLERVYTHLAEIGLASNNPATQASIKGFGDGKDKPTRFLTIEERGAVIRTLGEQFEEILNRGRSLEEWLTIRDLALIGVFLGAGLKVGNVTYLTLNCINIAEARIELSQAHYTHRARILPFALPLIRTWIEVREKLVELASVSEVSPLFLADRKKGFGRSAKGNHMHASAIFRRVKRSLTCIGIEGERCSPQTLRNTYASILIDSGASDDELVDFLGLQASITAKRLRGALFLSRKTKDA